MIMIEQEKGRMSEAVGEEKTPIGVAWMEEDRSIVVRIRTQLGDRVAEANMLFTTKHSKYQKVLSYLGGLEPDEAKSVFEWDFSLSS
ncbi:MAG TPA: hypothetical protein V6C69_18730 [Trichormus sp.]|jgi:hypothetical protein